MAFWQCNYHIIWGTKNKTPSITVQMEPILFACVQQKVEFVGGQLLGINAVADHIHVAAAIPPDQAVAYVVGQIKGASSREMNQNFTLNERFRWQESYGVLTFGNKVLPQVLDYIARQKEHHRESTIIPYLERIDPS